MTNEEIKAYKGNPAGAIFGLMEHIRPKKCKMVNGGNKMTNKEAIEMFKAIIMAEIDRLPHHYDAEVGDDVYDNTSSVNELLQLNKIVSKHGKRLWTTYEQNVFAWRYIEPFKEEE